MSYLEWWPYDSIRYETDEINEALDWFNQQIRSGTPDPKQVIPASPAPKNLPKPDTPKEDRREYDNLNRQYRDNTWHDRY